MLAWTAHLTPQQVARVAYALAALELTTCRGLVEALVQRAGALLRAQLAAAGATARGSSSSGGGGSSGDRQGAQGGQAQAAAAAAAAGPAAGGAAGAMFVASDYASLMWALATLEHRPAREWLDALCM